MKWQVGKKQFIELTENDVVLNTIPMNMSGGNMSNLLSAMTATMKTLTIPYDQISSVAITEGGWLSSPFIQILSGGERVINDSNVAMNSPNCVVFTKHEMEGAVKLKAEIERRVLESKVKHKAAPISGADELMKFAELLKSGVISQEEFETKKKKILEN
jgi:hypothetical protein